METLGSTASRSVGVDRASCLGAMSAASEALDRQDLPGAAAGLIRAATFDPFDPEPRVLLKELLPLVAAA
jgi:hypothetical protein